MYYINNNIKYFIESVKIYFARAQNCIFKLESTFVRETNRQNQNSEVIKEL